MQHQAFAPTKVMGAENVWFGLLLACIVACAAAEMLAPTIGNAAPPTPRVQTLR